MTDLGMLAAEFSEATEVARRARVAAYSVQCELSNSLRAAWDEYRVLFADIARTDEASAGRIPELHRDGFGEWAVRGVIVSVVVHGAFASVFTRSNACQDAAQEEARIPAVVLQPGGLQVLRGLADGHTRRMAQSHQP